MQLTEKELPVLTGITLVVGRERMTCPRLSDASRKQSLKTKKIKKQKESNQMSYFKKYPKKCHNTENNE